MNPLRSALIAVHVLIAIAVLAALCRHLGERAQEVNEVRQVARKEHNDTEHLRDEITRLGDLRAGVERADPYVIELLAREKLHFTRQDEKTPPPLPAIDRRMATDNR